MIHKGRNHWFRAIIAVCSCIFTLALVSVSDAANPPALFFSDLTDGPRTGWEGSTTKGAAVSIWGLNFGAAGASAKVTVGGQDIASTDTGYIAEWNVDAGVRGMKRITFWLKSACNTGAQTISVTTSDGTSNSLSFYVRTSGNIRFVDHTNGSDSYNGTFAVRGSGSNGPWKTLPYARKNMGNSTIVYVRAGTYSEQDNYGGAVWLDGTATSGAANAMSAFVGYPGEFPVIDTRTSGLDCGFRNNAQYTGDAHHWTISKFKIYPSGIAIGISDSLAGNFRIVGIEVDGLNKALPNSSTWTGVIAVQNLSDAQILGCHIHHWGRDKYDHATYWGPDANCPNRNALNLVAAYNEIHDLGTETSGIYSHPVDSGGTGYADGVYIYSNSVYNLSHGGIFVNSRHKNVYVYNNIVVNCGSSSRPAVQLDCPASPVSSISFFNNVVYSSGYCLVNLSGDNARANVSFKNNIFYSMNNAQYFNDSSYAGTRSGDYDDYYGGGSKPSWEGSHTLAVNPLFVNASSLDLHLQSSSPLKGAGTSTVNTLVTMDFDGTSRLQSALDMGAYQNTTSTVVVSPPQNLTVLSQ